MNERALIEWVEAKEAPMPLLAVQGFANTVDVESGTDLLDSRESFREWLARTELAADSFRLSQRDLEDARALREPIRDLLIANEQDARDPAAARRLGEFARGYRVPLTGGPEGELVLDVSPAETPDDLVAKLLGIILQAQADGSWARLKLCEDPECRWAFYDNSRNRSGSWCRLGLCGNKIKNRAYRERRSKAAGAQRAAAR